MASAAQPMTPPLFSCYGVVRRVDAHALQMEGAIAPRYATFHRQCDYIGLRTTAAEAFERGKEESMEPAAKSLNKNRGAIRAQCQTPIHGR